MKKIGTIDGAKFDLWFMNMNGCDDRGADDERLGLGSLWAQNYQETFTSYALIRESHLEKLGGFVTYAQNRFRLSDPPTPPPDYATVYSDTNAFTVVNP